MDVIVIQNYLLATMATLLLFHLFFFGKICLGQKIVFYNIDEKRKRIISSKVRSLGVVCLVLMLRGVARVVAKEGKNRRP